MQSAQRTGHHLRELVALALHGGVDRVLLLQLQLLLLHGEHLLQVAGVCRRTPTQLVLQFVIHAHAQSHQPAVHLRLPVGACSTHLGRMSLVDLAVECGALLLQGSCHV